MVDGFGQCDVDLQKAFLDSLSSADNATEASTKCFEKIVTGDFIRDLLVETLRAGDIDEESEASKKLIASLLSCSSFDTEN